MICIMTNEWTSVEEALPPCGRVVICVRELLNRFGESHSMQYVLARWNGVAWIEPTTGKGFDDDGQITFWYMFERWFYRKEGTIGDEQ